MADKGTEPKKFQTRAGISRKSKEEREQYARDEAARQQQRLAESAQTPTSAPEKGRPSGRGRLNALSSSTPRIRSENTGGVFGAAAPSLPKPRGGRLATGASLAAEDGGQSLQQGPLKEILTSTAAKKTEGPDARDGAAVKPEKKTTRARATAKKDEPAYVLSEDEADDEARRDIEQIWISSDEEAVSSKVNGKQREKSSARNGTALRPLRAPRDSRLAGEALSARNRVLATVTKKETGPAGEDALRGPTVKDDNARDTSDTIQPHSTGDIDRKTSKRKGARLKDATAVTETVEERAERMRYNEEVRKLVGELSQHKSPSQTAASHTSTGHLEGRRLYLFQFPPLTPVLADPTEEIEVKQEAEVEPQPVPSTSERTTGAILKKEEGVVERTKKSDVLTADNMQLPSGLAGTLKVHKSGKVTLDWGGVDLEVRYGTEVDFLQDVVITDDTEQTAWALGQVEKKMVCIPNWQKLYE